MANNRADQLKEITERLEQGVKDIFTSEMYTKYLLTMSKFHNYSFNNTLLIAMQRPDATLVAGYNAWKNKFNRYVKKGEKGIQIIAPVPVKEREAREKIDKDTGLTVLNENGEPEMEVVERVIPRFRLTTVFDYAQTDGEPLPMLEVNELTASVKDYNVLKAAIEQVSPVQIRFDEIDGSAKGYYSHMDKEICVRPDMGESQTIKTMIHEVAHAMLHDSDQMKQRGEEKDQLTKETEAESIAFTVCSALGIDTSDYSFPYVASWAGSKELKELRDSMDTIRLTAADFLEKLEAAVAERSVEQMTAMQYAEKLILDKEQQKTIFDDEQRNLIVNFAYKLDDRAATENLVNDLATALLDGNKEEANRLVWEAQEKIENLPDSMIGLSEMHEYGYLKDDVLPLTKEGAREWHRLGERIYPLFRDGTAGDFASQEEIEQHDGIFGIKADAWSAILLEKNEEYLEDEYARPDAALTVISREQALRFFDEGKQIYLIRISPWPILVTGREEIERGSDYFQIAKDDLEKDRQEVMENSNKAPIEKLAADLDDFAFDFDFYHYKDSVEDREQAVEALKEQILAGDVQAIKDWLQTAVEESKGEPAEKASALIDRLDAAVKEQTLLAGREKQFGIYQITARDPEHDYRFMNLDFVKRHGMEVNRADYELVYTAPLTENDTLEAIYERFNIQRPDDFTGHSLSVSDVVVMNDGDSVKACYVDSIGFAELPDFFKERKMDLQKESFLDERLQEIEIFDKPGLFSDSRLRDEDVPEGLYRYDLRGSDYDPGRPIMIEKNVIVNHAASVLMAEELDLGKDSRLELGEEGLNFTGELLTVREFMEEQEQKRNGLIHGDSDHISVEGHLGTWYGMLESMVQRVYRQIRCVDPNANVTIATSKSQVSAIHNQLGENVGISVEPCRRDTFPAIALAAAYLKDKKHLPLDEAIVVCPVDPYVDNDYFEALEALGKRAAESTTNLVLMGIEPTYPSAKYGYIIPESREEISPVLMFKEKPTEEVAQTYIAQGALWNGGVFALRLGYVLERAHQLIDFTDYQDLFDKYETLQKISFDYAVVEHEEKIEVMRFSGMWKDLGTWNTLTEAMDSRNVGQALFSETCQNVHVVNELNLPVLCMGLKDVVVSASPDGILVSDKKQSSYIKPLVNTLDHRVMFAEKSWGSFRVLDVEKESLTIKVTLNPNHRMNYHSHEFRDEVWTIISGTGRVILNEQERKVKPGDVIEMKAGCRHTIIADTELKLIEVQMGKDINVLDKIKY